MSLTRPPHTHTHRDTQQKHKKQQNTQTGPVHQSLETRLHLRKTGGGSGGSTPTPSMQHGAVKG